MTPKAKAIQLFQRFLPLSHATKMGLYGFDYDEKTQTENTKLICVDCINEILNANPHGNPLNGNAHLSSIDYWVEVKNEIEKL